MAKKRVDRALVQRAKATAFLQTDPEAQTLTQLLRGAASDYAGQVAVERGAARGVVNTIKAAVPKVTAYYNQADQTRAASQAYIDQRLAPLSHAADDIKAGSASEAAGFMRRLGETRAATLGEFQSRKVDAKAGAAFAVRSATDQYRVDSGKIRDQLTALQRRKGVITTVALNDAIKAEEQAAQARRTENRLVTGQKETARHNRATESQAAANSRQRKRAANKKANDAARKLAIEALGGALPKRAGTPSSRVRAKDHYGLAVTVARNNARHWLAGGKDPKTGQTIPPASRSEIVQLLTKQTGGSVVLARAALQTVLDGGVHHRTRLRARHRYGISLPPKPKYGDLFTL
jgi:hypothetical protein